MPHHEKHPTICSYRQDYARFWASICPSDRIKERAGRSDAAWVGDGRACVLAIKSQSKASRNLRKSKVSEARIAMARHLKSLMVRGVSTNMRPADPAIATKAAMSAGYEVVGEPRRKPKHFEVLGRKKTLFAELHIGLDGDIRKSKPVPPEGGKWQSEIEEASAARGA